MELSYKLVLESEAGMRLRGWSWAAIAVLLIGSAAVYLHVRQTQAFRRVFVIGWEDNPPSQIATPNGEPTGFSIELIKEAARRRGIWLRWEEHLHQADYALDHGLVDLWARMTVTAERRRRFAFTVPLQEHDYGFLVNAASPYQFAGDLRNARVAYDGIPFGAALLHQYFPRAETVAANGLREAMQRLCRGEVPAVFGERFTAFSTLIESNPCPDTALRVIPILSFRTQVAIATVRNGDAPVAADAIRDEIDRMVDDGTAARMASSWGYPASQDLLSLLRSRETRRTLWYYRLWLVAFGILCLFAIWVAAAYRLARNRAEAAGKALRQTERKLRLLASSLSEMVLSYDHERRLIYANPGAQQLTGYSLAELKKAEFACWVHPDDREKVLAGWQCAYEGLPVKQTYRVLTKYGELRWVAANWDPTYDEDGVQIGVQASERDVSERIRAEEERTSLQQQLLQSQKLESVGRLAGGIAHDFNNMLTVILGFGHLLLASAAEPKAKEQANEIVKAATRASELTSQLLSFSRKQVIQPRLLRIDELIEESSRMLRRLIGESIELQVVLHPESFPILADPGQIQQVLINLAINARDAMPGGGWLLIETDNVTLDASYAATHAEVTPGDYLQITVTDSGTGMDQSTLARVFEPFFTTKSAGKGTGLGLATIYGIVKQASGHIWVYSEPGKGTSFKIYFPRTHAVPIQEEVSPAPVAVHRPRNETILLVED